MCHILFLPMQNGNSALSIAKRLGYISVVDTLKVVTEETLTTQVRWLKHMDKWNGTVSISTAMPIFCVVCTDGHREAQDERSRDHERGAGHVG